MVFQQKISLGCNCPNFTECDRCVLNLLQPHLTLAEEERPAFSQIQQILRLFKQALDPGVCDRFGDRWSSAVYDSTSRTTAQSVF
jgi:hypothetical protein